MTWTIIIFPIQVFILLIPALLINALLLFLGWYIWHHMSQPHIPYAARKRCCVCGQKGAYAVQYVSSDDAQNLVTNHLCSACLGQLLRPVNDEKRNIPWTTLDRNAQRDASPEAYRAFLESVEDDQEYAAYIEHRYTPRADDY